MVVPLVNRAVRAVLAHGAGREGAARKGPAGRAVAPPAHQPEVRGPPATRAVVRRADVVATIVGPDPLVGVGRSGVQPAR
jgi:hypothetical protein